MWTLDDVMWYSDPSVAGATAGAGAWFGTEGFMVEVEGRRVNWAEAATRAVVGLVVMRNNK